MRLIQYLDSSQQRAVAAFEDDAPALKLDGVTSVYALALEAGRGGAALADLVRARMSRERVDYAALIAARRILPPLDHLDAARWIITGTGLSHLGSAAARDAMHAKLQKQESELTDSMKMFKWGVEGGKPAPGAIGVQPEWFYKGDGRCVVAPEHGLELPPYANDGGDEVEVVGLYVIGDDGAVLRVGFALGNEYADHVMERKNYLYLAHSKLRQCSYGPELLLGALPRAVHGRARLLRGGEEVWSSDWLSGEDNMAHSVANLEHHHFKYADFRRPGDVHVHFFGAATGSFTANVSARVGDVFEISAQGFGHALRNPLMQSARADAVVAVRTL